MIDFIKTQIGSELTSLAKRALLQHLKHPTAKTVPRLQAVDFINDESNGCFIGSIDVDNEWVTLIFK